MELAVGRASRKSAVQGYQALEPAGSKWHIHGWFCMAGCYLLMMYYTTVAGWMLDYFAKFATGQFVGMESGHAVDAFNAMLANPVEMGIWMVVIVIAGFAVVSFGLQNGLERISKYMMIALLVLIVILAVNSVLLPGAGSGVSFYLLPSVERASEVGIGNVAMAAMNQSFFTLSLGIAAMEIFGSYMKRDNTLPGEAIRICALDTFVALMSGMIIFPACFAYGIEPDQGPSLIFITLTEVFVNMPGGRLWGSLFFVFMTFASFTTVIAVFENILVICCDCFGWDRKKSCLINMIIVLVASVPCVLGYNVWSGLTFLGGKNVLDTEDFLVSNLLLPVGSLIFLLFCVSKWGWGYDKYFAEANTGEGIKLPKSKWLESAKKQKSGGAVPFGARSRQFLFHSKQPEKADVVDPQKDEQGDQRHQHPDQDVHLVDAEGEVVVDLFLLVFEVGVAVVQQAAFVRGGALGGLGLAGGKFGFAGRQGGFPRGQLGLPLLCRLGGGLGVVFSHGNSLLWVQYKRYREEMQEGRPSVAALCRTVRKRFTSWPGTCGCRWRQPG